MHVGFIGLGNVGGKLSGSLLRNGTKLSVHDLNKSLVTEFVSRGAIDGQNPRNIMQTCDVIITCLPSPSASNEVMQVMLEFITPKKVWMEMSTTDEAEVKRLGALIKEKELSLIHI